MNIHDPIAVDILLEAPRPGWHEKPADILKLEREIDITMRQRQIRLPWRMKQ